MEYTAKTTTLKHAALVVLLTTVIAGGGYTLFSKSKQVRAENSEASKITKERLDAFYDVSVEVHLAGEKDAVAFYEKHLHKEYDGVTHLSMRVDNTPQQKETLVLTKFDYLRSIRKAYKISLFKELQSGVVSFDISEDGRSAKVKDRTYLMSIIPQTKSESYNLRQFVSCDQFFVLNENGVLQLKSGTCQVEGQMSKAQAL